MRFWNISIKLPQVIPPVILFVIVSTIYIHNLSQSVFGGDVGDFASAIATRGVPHPSGYPLFTLLGILVSFLPLAKPLAWKIGLLNAFFSSWSIVFFYLVSLSLTKSKLASFIASLSLGFFSIFWLYAEIGEVFALVNFFVLLLILLLVKYREKRKIGVLWAISFVYGLSLSHHEILIALFPAIGIVVLWANKSIFRQWRQLLLLPVFFLLGLIPYLYIPIAASFHPVVNWDNPITLHNFLSLVLRLDYGWKANTGVDTSLRMLAVKVFFQRILTEITPAGIVLVLLGIGETIRRKLYPYTCAFLVSFILFGPVYVVYGFTPLFSSFVMGVLERFYMIASLFLFFFLPFGIVFVAEGLAVLLQKLSGRKKVLHGYILLFSAIFFILPFSLFRFNFPKTDLHNLWIGDTLGSDFLSPLPKKSLLVLSGDSIFFNTEYMHVARGVRSDVQVVNIGTLQTTPQLSQKIKKIKKEKKGIADDQAYLLGLQQLVASQPVYASAIIEGKKNSTAAQSQFVWVPEGIVFAYMKKEQVPSSASDFLQQNKHVWSGLHVPDAQSHASLAAHNLTIASIPQIYAQGYVNEGNFLVSQYQDYPDAAVSFSKALTIDPTNQNALIAYGFSQTVLGECSAAKTALQKAIAFYPDNKTAYFYLYGVFVSCFKDTKKAAGVVDIFSRTFHSSLIKEIQQSYKDATK